MFFNNWENIYRTLVVGVLAYIALVSMLRVSGKRTLSKMNAFDLVVTMALGSTLATILLSKKVALAEGITAFFVLIGMQYIITWLSMHVNWIKRFSKSDPALLFYKGSFCRSNMRKNRVLEEEILQAIRNNGQSPHESVDAVILETDGSFSVIGNSDAHTEKKMMYG